MSDTNQTPTVAVTQEISGALLSIDVHAFNGVADFKANPEAFMMSNFGFNPFTGELSVAENDSGTLNICLPYYTWLEEAKAQVLDDTEAEDVAAGEIFLFAVPSLIAVGIAAGVGGSAAVAQNNHNAAVERENAALAAAQTTEEILRVKRDSLFLEVHGDNAVVNPLAGGRFL